MGIVTDGDLRRNMSPGLLDRTAAEIMTRNPKTVRPDMLASAVLQIINASAITALFVVEKACRSALSTFTISCAKASLRVHPEKCEAVFR